MPIYATHDGHTVVNVIVAESQQIAEDVSGLTAIETNGAPWLGWTQHGTDWRPPTPYSSWVWNAEALVWEAPLPYPEGGNGYTWDEESGSWIEIPTASLDPEDETPAP